MIKYVIINVMDFNIKSLLGGILFGKGDKSVLGIDIGTSSIKIVQLKKEKERAVLETYGEIATGPYVNLKVGQAAKLSEEVVIDAMKDLLKEANIAARNAIVAIPLRSSFVTTINLPFVPDKDTAEAVQIEARRYIPLPISEVAIDWWLMPESVEKEGGDEGRAIKESSQVLLAAIHKDVINTYKNIISKSGLKAMAYEIESFGMVRSIIGRENSPVAIMDFGASTTKLAIVDHGLIKMSHSISHGSQDLTLALSHSLTIDFERAEEMKRTVGLSELPEYKETISVIEPILDYIFAETGNIIKAFQKKHSRSIGKVILTGGGSLLNGLVGFAVKKLAIETELADPFSKVEHPVFLSKTLKGVGAEFSVALGLAIREL